ncbi:MAG: hypothetical protein KJ066_22170 [Acidobacteria bacterium]|nr:hypothetical protein [Acidobacteriota bacterium]
MAAGLLDDAEYRANFLQAWRARLVHPTVERLIWELHHGRPRQSLAVELDAAIRAAPFELRGPAGELLSLVVPAVGSFEWRDGGFDFTPAELPPAGLLSKRDDDDES